MFLTLVQDYKWKCNGKWLNELLHIMVQIFNRLISWHKTIQALIAKKPIIRLWKTSSVIWFFFSKYSFKNAFWWMMSKTCSHSECRVSHIIVCASHSPTISDKSRFLRHEKLMALGKKRRWEEVSRSTMTTRYIQQLWADSFSFLVLF